MIEQLRTELSDLAAKLERLKKIESMLQDLTSTERELSQREQALKATLSKEEADVDRLERTSAASILFSVLGKMEEKLDKEQKEALSAKLKYDAAVRQLDDCKAGIELLQQEKAALSGCPRRYEEVFATCQNLLRTDPAYAERLCALERQRGETVSQLKELDEAIGAGNAAMRQIKAVEEALDSAEGWGQWDLFGGGLLADMAKHSHLDEAQSGAEYLQVLLSRFKTELADVHISAQLDAVNIEGFLRFADFFFDGLIADWTVLDHIRGTQDSVYRVRQQVMDALSRLNMLRAARSDEKATLDMQLAELVAKD